jgi:hypothetical protein
VVCDVLLDREHAGADGRRVDRDELSPDVRRRLAVTQHMILCWEAGLKRIMLTDR